MWLEVQDDDVCAVDLLDDLAMAPNKVAVCARYSCMARLLRRSVTHFHTLQGRPCSGSTAAQDFLANQFQNISFLMRSYIAFLGLLPGRGRIALR